ncbi:MAG: PorT family protein [Saprospiraceae bacterium]|nr:PorT family protein [Saprospiraceae bacterium]
MQKILIGFVCMLCVLQATSQHITIGPTIGLNNSWISESKNIGGKSKIGFNAGISFIYSIKENYGLGVDAIYSVEGNKFDPDGTRSLNYLRIPIKAYYFFGEWGDKFRPKLFLGLSPAFLIGGNIKQGNQEFKSKDFNKGFDLGLNVGTGLNVRIMEATWLKFDLGYTHGLTKIFKNTSNNSKNQNINFNIGIGFPIGE